MKDLKDIQIEIKKELGGASLNHLLNYLEKEFGFIVVLNCNNCLYINFDYCEKEFEQDFILLNENKHCNNIFGQSEEFQRNLYKAMQTIKNINNK
jgi:hypothetical protein